MIFRTGESKFAMTDIPIIFSGPMVQALLAGRKTMTRRLARRELNMKKKGPIAAGLGYAPTSWQRVRVGDRLWVRENMKISKETLIFASDAADVPKGSFAWQDWMYAYGEGGVPSIHMPRWASRLTLIVTATKIERVQDIANSDAIAEGCGVNFDHPNPEKTRETFPALRFRDLWMKLHGLESWDENLEVVALTFRVIKANIDAPEACAA